jgi:diguanylate cyclase (GGDEF)-like protein/PAS domain S-box-containing protein
MSTLTLSGNQARLLVVDDERINREILTRLLQRSGYHVTIAQNGREALNLLAAEAFDLLLLDVNMPEMDGFSCLEQVRHSYSVTQLPVIMVTGESDRQTTVRAFQAGANDFVSKPIDPDITLVRIKTHLLLRDSQVALRVSEERYALAAKGANDGLWDWDLQQNLLYLSPRWKEMLGYVDEEIGSDPEEWFSRIHEEDRENFRLLIQHSKWEKESQFERELRMRYRDGTYRWMNCRGLVLPTAAGKARRVSGSLTEITQGKVGDSLTGLPNRLLFIEKLEKACDQRRRTGSSQFAVLFLDLDKFKLVNDSLGHQIGDCLLTAAASRLEKCVRSSDTVCKGNAVSTVARLGGDEFTILLNNMTHTDDAAIVAQRIISAFSEPFLLSGKEVFIGVSVGISTGNAGNCNPEELLREADTAMYYAKSEGRGRFRIYEPEMLEIATKRMQLEQDLRKAFQSHEFYLNYQPIIDLRTQAISGFEALLRWKHPGNEYISPASFIPTAEDIGLIIPLGLWVFENASYQAKAWNDKFPNAPALVISINCSILQLQQPNFIQNIETLVKKTGVSPNTIKVEVTESTLMQKPELVCPILTQLREMGIRIGIDDFGTGYSSLAYLHRLPLDELKVDRSFVSTMTDSAESLEIVRTIITLGRSLRLDVIAEGVETEIQQKILFELGCTHAQGYLYSRPLSEEKVEQVIQQWVNAPSNLLLSPDIKNAYDLQTPEAWQTVL